jgi:hypothetical protein
VPAKLADLDYPSIRQDVVVEQLDPGPFADRAGSPAVAGQIPETFAAMRFCHSFCSFRESGSTIE